MHMKSCELKRFRRPSLSLSAVAAFPVPPPWRGKCKNPFNTLWVAFIYCILEVYFREGFLSFTFLSHSFSETGYPIWYLWCSQVNKVRWRALKNSKLWLDLLLWERSISAQQSWLTIVLFCGVSCLFRAFAMEMTEMSYTAMDLHTVW